MSGFKAEMHQIRFRLGLRPRPQLGELAALPRPPIAGFKGIDLLLRGGEGLAVSIPTFYSIIDMHV